MGTVLTRGSSVQCQTVPPPPPSTPPPGPMHGGAVSTASSARLTVSGKPVLLKSSVEGQTITGCQTPASSSTQPCTKVGAVATGLSTKLTVGGAPVLLQDTLAGTTVGAPAGQLAAVSNQTKLTAK